MTRLERKQIQDRAAESLAAWRYELVTTAVQIRMEMATLSANPRNRSRWGQLRREAGQLDRTSGHLTDALEDLARAQRPFRARAAK
jgi:hypothetical protein